MDIFGYDPANVWDYENGFYLVSDPTRLGKILAHYELYKKIVQVPGHVIELGVFKGASFIRFLTFRNLLETQQSRRVTGFDAFGDFPLPSNEHDKRFARNWQHHAGSGIPVDELHKALKQKRMENYELVPGDILKTLPEYLASNPQLKVALLHIDTDVFEPARLGLELLWERIVRGGLVIFDDYGTEYGGTLAVDEFLQDRDLQLAKLPLSHATPAFLVKP